MATIDDLAPVLPAPFPPRLRVDSGTAILSVVTADGRLHRLELTPNQVAALAGDVAAIVLKQAPTH